jgi:hypothetical protein
MSVQAKFEILAQDKTQQAFASVKRSLGGLERAFGGMKTAIVSAIGAAGFGALIKDSLNLGDSIKALSQRLGASAESLSQYRYAAKLSNIDFESLTKTWETMQRNIGMAAMGTGRAKDFIKNLGIDAKEFAKLAPEQQFEKLADKLMAIKNPAERAAYAFRIMGSDGVKMLQMMEGGSAGMKALREEADRLGLTITRDMADKMDSANDQIDRVKLAFSGLGIVLATQLAPVILRVGEAFLRGVQWIRDHQDALAALAKLVAAGGALVLGIRALSIAVSAMEVAFIASSNAVRAFLIAFAVSPITAFTTSLGGISVEAVAATGALGKLKIAAGILFAAFAGWQIGSWLRENFVEARVAGLAFIGALLKGWESLKYSVEVAWLAISSGWDKAIGTMKESFAGFLQFVASGLSNIPFAKDAAGSLTSYADGLKISANSAADFSIKLADLTQKHTEAKAQIDENITGLVSFELGVGKAKEVTQQHTQAVQYAGVALGELGKQHQGVNKLLEEGKRLTDDLRTPMEVYQQNIIKINSLLEKGYINQDTYNRALKKFGKDYDDSAGITESLDKQKKAYEEHVNDVTGIFKNSFFAFLDEGFDGMVKSFENALKAMAADAAAAEVGKMLFGNISSGLSGSSGGGGGSLLGQFLGDGFGKLFGFGSFGGFRAGGGSVSSGTSYIVGENEPELFTPTTNGFITPLSKTSKSSGTTVVINNNIQTPDADSFRRAEGNLTARMKMQLDRAGQRNL